MSSNLKYFVHGYSRAQGDEGGAGHSIYIEMHLLEKSQKNWLRESIRGLLERTELSTLKPLSSAHWSDDSAFLNMEYDGNGPYTLEGREAFGMHYSPKMEEELAEYERGLEEIFRQEPVRVNGRFIHVPPASFVVGQTIKVSDGPLKGMKGRIVTVHPLEGRLSVSFEVMGKELREEIHYCEVCRDTIN